MKNDDLINILDDYFNSCDKNKERKKTNFYPSSVGQCSRKIVYGMLGYEVPEKDAALRKIMDLGTSIHNTTEKYFEKADVLIANEASFNIKNDEGKDICVGRTDAIIKNFREHNSSDNIIKIYSEEHDLNEEGRWVTNEDGTYKTHKELVYEGPDNDVILIEIKSINLRTYNDLLKKTKPLEKHELQLQLYLNELKVKNGIVFYVCKDNSKYLQFDVDYDEQKSKIGLDQIKLCTYCRDNEVLPKREYEKESFDCMYCDYLKYCYPDMYDLRLARKNIAK